ncbi:MAG: glutaminyl-peptide cyclotransferase [Cyclobacteriaceae bacterium]|nr:glutaminyl-peptide cyclotransferase [Cyclobacteriaceae bacterium]
MSYRIVTWVVGLGVFGLLFSCSSDKEKAQTSEADTLRINYAIRSLWPHDPEAFTQGLLIHNGELYESTGQHGTSWIGVVDINTGKVDKKVVLDKQYFGEGIAILNNKVFQLTWQNKVGFVYDLKTFKKIKEFKFDSFAKEGWGLTHDHVNLIMSDGTDKLHYLDTVTLEVVKSVKVTDESGPVKNLNELEYIEGYVFANVWQTNLILKIDPNSGKVVGRIDLSKLASDARKASPQVDVLNGIAWHPETKSILVTGKNWPNIYILKLEESQKQ